MIRAALANAARHYPVPVTFEGETVDRRAFLDGSIHAEDMERTHLRRLPGPQAELHGARSQLLRPDRAPCACPRSRPSTAPSGPSAPTSWDCPGLELLLPARREPVENAFLEELRQAARLAIYRAMAADPEPRPAFADWTRARGAGIELPPPPEVLRPWRPVHRRHRRLAGAAKARARPAPMHWSWTSIPSPPRPRRCGARRERAGLAERLFEADRRLEGYEWHDRLDRVTGIDTEGHHR